MYTHVYIHRNYIIQCMVEGILKFFEILKLITGCEKTFLLE